MERVTLERDLKQLVLTGYHAIPRHLQVALGPSETGATCHRQLAYSMMHEPECNGESDPLASLFGTAMHTQLEGFAVKDNERLGFERWIPETKVVVRPGLSGHSDLYDTVTHTVVDYKCPGPTRFKYYVTNGPSGVYRKQFHQYGYGFENAGYQVDNVAMFLLPRAGTLRKAHLWMEPYDRQIALDVLKNLDNITLTMDALEVETKPERYQLIPITPSDDCRFCPFFAPNPVGPYQCKGNA
ncbi:MAG: hypothetical protein ABIY38_07895 [Rhodococcus sp. (in: high G+C Gram-positive bacteria)]